MFLVSRQAGCHPIAQGSPLSVLSHQGADALRQEATLYSWGRRTVILVIQTLVTRPPLSPAVHLLGVSSELGVLLGKSVCVCMELKIATFFLPSQTIYLEWNIIVMVKRLV